MLSLFHHFLDIVASCTKGLMLVFLWKRVETLIVCVRMSAVCSVGIVPSTRDSKHSQLVLFKSSTRVYNSAWKSCFLSAPVKLYFTDQSLRSTRVLLNVLMLVKARVGANEASEINLFLFLFNFWLIIFNFWQLRVGNCWFEQTSESERWSK